MRRDDRTLLFVALAVVGALALAIGWWRYREAGRPVLLEVRVVTASDHDPVFRDGRRDLQPGEDFQAAAVLHLRQRGRGEYWLAPVRDLVMGGRPVEHEQNERWPEQDRIARVFWSTVECTNLGGEISSDNAAKRLAYRTFLAPEMGRALLAKGSLTAHNDDFIADTSQFVPDHSGTLRFYARVEVVEQLSDIKPLQAASSLGADELWSPAMPTVSRRLETTAGIRPEAGELFLLPGFEPVPAPGDSWNDTTEAALGHSFTDLVERRLVTSSWTFAATAVSGDATLDPDSLRDLGSLEIATGGLRRHGRTLRWGHEVEPGDLLHSSGHWIVLAHDDGDGILDLTDTVLHCWRRPPQQLPLLDALDQGARSVELLRHAPRP